MTSQVRTGATVIRRAKKPMSKAGRLIAMFGGVNKMARETGLQPATISRFNSYGPRGKRGIVPPEHNATIIAAAARLGLGKGVLECLEDHRCPTCGQELEPGQTINR